VDDHDEAADKALNHHTYYYDTAVVDIMLHTAAQTRSWSDDSGSR
jgi:hypothetical protein